jgi:uncharacterized protein (TIGR02246 family)
MGTPAADLPHSDALGKPVGDELTSGPEPDEDTVNAVLAALDAANAPDDFDKADYAAADWTFISPGGELYPGREATLRLFRELEDEDFMQGGGFTIENRSLRFASDDVAVVTETGVSDPFVAPNGVKNSAQRAQTTSVFVNGEQGWLLRHTHMTIVTDG